MSPQNYLLDTSAIVALLVKRDQNHSRSLQLFDKLSAPFLTCEAVLAEACFLLNLANSQKRSDIVLELGKTGFYQIGLKLEDHFAEIHELLLKYKEVPISLADACLIRCAEVWDQPNIVTFDSDFKIYRWEKRRKFQVVE